MKELDFRNGTPVEPDDDRGLDEDDPEDDS